MRHALYKNNTRVFIISNAETSITLTHTNTHTQPHTRTIDTSNLALFKNVDFKSFVVLMQPCYGLRHVTVTHTYRTYNKLNIILASHVSPITNACTRV